jgi:hypothetical protein
MSSATAQATLALNASQFTAALSQASNKLDQFAGQLSSSLGTNLVAKLAAVSAGVIGVSSAFDALQSTVSTGVLLNSSLEQTKMALATLLGQFEGDRFGDFNSRTREAGKILEMLREKGQFAEATFANLANTLQMTAGTFFSSGVKGAEQQADMIVAVSQALAAYGGDQASLTSEVTSLLRGQVNAWDRVARGAKITAEELKKAKAEGNLFNYVMGKLSSVTADSAQGMTTFASLTTIMREELDNLQTSLTKPMFEGLKEGLMGLNEGLKSDEFAEGVKKLSYEIALVVKAGMNLLATLIKALPTLMDWGRNIANFLVPALGVLIVHKIATGRAALALAGMFQKMGASVTMSMTSMAVSTKAAFASMLKSGQMAAIGIQLALAAAMAGFMLAMQKVATINQRIDETNNVGDAMQDDAKRGMAARGIKQGPNGYEQGAYGISTEAERQEELDSIRARQEQVKRERDKFAGKANDSQEDQMLLDAYNARLQNLDREEQAVKNISAARMDENAAAKEALKLEQERAAHLAELPNKIKEASQALKETQEKITFDALTPEEQREQVAKDAKTTVKTLDTDIARMQELENNGQSDDGQREWLLGLLEAKKKILSIDQEIAKETAKNAEKEAEMEKRRQKTIEEHISAMREKQAILRGDEQAATAEKDERNRKSIEQSLISQGFTPEQAKTMSGESVAVDKEIRASQQKSERGMFEKELAATVARATGDATKADQIEKEQRRDEMIKRQKSMGYSDEEAEKNVDSIFAAEEASKLQQQISSAQKDFGPMFASSGTSVGAGGYSVGGGLDPMIEENKRHTRLLETIAQNTGAKRTPNASNSSISNWEN